MFKFLTSIVCLATLFSSLHAYAPYKEYNLVEGLPNVLISPMGERIGHTWVKGVVWDKPLIQKFYSVLAQHRGDFVILDLGAQTGSFSLLAKFFPESQWHSFEPIQEAADCLKRHLLMNNISNVSVYQMAASDIPGKAMLKMPQLHSFGLATLGSNVLRYTPVDQREVKCIDLDSFVSLNHIQKVDFMKLDTEGWEYYILQGAKNLILRDRPILLMEYNETNMQQCGVTKQQIDSFLREMGYQWSLISTEDILCFPL